MVSMMLPRLLTPEAGEGGVENIDAAETSASSPLRCRCQLSSLAQDVARVHFNDHIFHLYDHLSQESESTANMHCAQDSSLHQRVARRISSIGSQD